MGGYENVRVAVIGAGPVGLIAGRRLLERGFTNLTIFEKEQGVGGTWFIHSYPGLNCDVKAHAYVFTGECNPDYSASYVGPEEIQPYLERSATKFGLDPHLRLGVEIESAVYQGGGEWKLTETSGEEHVFDFVINAMGNQHTPIFPEVPGLEKFRGDAWHSTEWNHDVDLAGKRVVVVGSAASAVQIVPEIAPQTAHLTVLQRSPNWILPRGKKPYSSRMKTALRVVPGFAGLHRFFLDLPMKLSHGASVLGHKTMDTVEEMGRKHIAEAIPDDAALREAVMPDSHFGCKRPLVSDGFYRALVRDDVRLIPEGVREVTETGLVTDGGETLEADVIVYCTGYKVLDFERIDVRGEDGVSLAGVMEKAPEAYKGIAVPGFPNYFLGVGPNGVLLSASFFVAAETNVEAIVRIMEQKEAAGAKAIDVRPELHREYNDWIASEREHYSWGVTSCDSYYRTPGGHTPFLFPGDLATFRRHRKEAGLHEFRTT